LLAGRSPKPAAAEVFRSLTEAVSVKGKPKAKEASRAFVIADGKKGVIRAGKGGAVTVELPRGVLPPARWAAFETALQKLLSDLPEAP
jgi:ParB family chromosome partitioning protein